MKKNEKKSLVPFAGPCHDGGRFRREGCLLPPKAGNRSSRLNALNVSNQCSKCVTHEKKERNKQAWPSLCGFKRSDANARLKRRIGPPPN
jgi:hypothetical protein